MKKIIIVFILVIVSLLFKTDLSYSKDEKPKIGPIQTFNLPNGQVVIIKEIHTNPIVSINSWVRTGSINENDENNGVSHFLEHLLFKGTKNYPVGEMTSLLESRGAESNAATSKDYTHFYITIASQNFDMAAKLHADMILNAAIPPLELEKERKVVIEEINRSEDTPQRQVFYGLNELMYKHHPYKYDTLGKAEIVKNIPREKIMEYYNKWYIPSNITTVIVGDVDTQQALDLIKTYFKSKPADKMSEIVYEKEPLLTEVKENVQEGDYKQAYMEIGFRSASMKDPKDTYALDVLAIILGQGRSSRLYKELKQDNNIVNSVTVSNLAFKDDGIFIFDFDLQPEKIDLVKKTVINEINNVKNNFVTEEELNKAKNQVARDFIFDNESVSNISQSVGYNVTVATLQEYTDYVAKINSVTLDDIKYVANKYLNDKSMTISILKPKGTSISGDDKLLVDNTTIKTSNSCIGNVNKVLLSNGMTLIDKQVPVNDVIAVNVFIKGGKSVQDKAGLANLLTSLLLKGTQSRSAKDIAQETEAKGIVIDVSPSDDFIKVTLKSTQSDFAEAFMILSDILKNSDFKQEEIDKTKETIKNAVKANQDSPMTYSLEKLFMNIYKNHPYGDVGEKIINELPNITREDIIDYYKKYFVPSNMIISVVGNIALDEVKSYVQQSWADDSKKIVNNDNKKVPGLAKNLLLKEPKNTEAAWISLAWLAPKVEDKEYAALKVIDAILGNGLSSRLSIALREKMGLAYSLGTFYPSRIDKSTFVMYIGTSPKNINLVINKFKKEISKLKSELVTKQELADVKQKLIGQFELSHETNMEQGSYLGWFESINLGYEYDKKFPELINTVTAEQIKSVAVKIFSQPFVLSIVAPEKAIKMLKEK